MTLTCLLGPISCTLLDLISNWSFILVRFIICLLIKLRSRDFHKLIIPVVSILFVFYGSKLNLPGLLMYSEGVLFHTASVSWDEKIKEAFMHVRQEKIRVCCNVQSSDVQQLTQVPSWGSSAEAAELSPHFVSCFLLSKEGNFSAKASGFILTMLNIAMMRSVLPHSLVFSTRS